MQRQQQLIPGLIPGSDEARTREVLAAELEALQACPALERLSPDRVRFALLYLLSDPARVSMGALAAQAGISERQAYRYRRDPEVLEALAEMARRFADQGFMRLVGGLAVAADRLAVRLLTGEQAQLSSSEQWLAGLALRRAGIDVGARLASATFRDPSGASTTLAVASGDVPAGAARAVDLAEALAYLAGRTRGRVAGEAEAVGGQSLPDAIMASGEQESEP